MKTTTMLTAGSAALVLVLAIAWSRGTSERPARQASTPARSAAASALAPPAVAEVPADPSTQATAEVPGVVKSTMAEGARGLVDRALGLRKAGALRALSGAFVGDAEMRDAVCAEAWARLAGADPAARRRLVLLLAALGDPRGVDLWTRSVLSDPDPAVRAEMLADLPSSDTAVRAVAMEALGSDAAEAVRLAAVRALPSDASDEDARRVTGRLALEPSTAVRLGIVRCLTTMRCSDAACVDALAALAQDPSEPEELRRQAWSALRKTERRSPGSVPPAVVARLEAELAERD